MIGLGRAVGVVGVALGLGAGVVFGAPYARDAGLLPAQSFAAPSSSAVGELQQTPFTRHMNLYFDADAAATHINALCGYPDGIVAGQTFLGLGDSDNPQLSVIDASSSDGLNSYRRFNAPASALFAYEEFDELVIQTDGERFAARSFIVEEDGEYGPSFPLENKRYHRLACDDAQAAADALNVLFEANGADMRPGINKVRSFAVTSIWDVGDQVVDLIDACTPTDLFRELPVGRPVLIDARYKPDGAYGNVENEMSGEYLEGTPTELLNLTIAERFDGDAANVLNYAAPIEWSDLPTTTNGFGPSYRFSAVHLTAFAVEPDGSQSHSEDMGGVPFVDIPCANIEAGRAILEALRDGTYVAPRDQERG